MKRIILILVGLVLICGCMEEEAKELKEEAEKGIEKGVEKAEKGIEKITDELRNVTPQEQAKSKCIELCESELASGRDLSDGPCLSNNITEDWVCDVAHSPRQSTDNNPANQCTGFREGKAHHFVEVDPECNFIIAR